jgi:hypothetical protein
VVFWITSCDIVGSGEMIFLLGFSPFFVLLNQHGDDILHVRTRSWQIVQEMDAESHLGSVESHLNVFESVRVPFVCWKSISRGCSCQSLFLVRLFHVFVLCSS